MQKYYSLFQDKKNRVADIYIHGDIVSYKEREKDVTGYNLVKELQALTHVDYINVYINSYGGVVKEGLAIYNALKRHSAQITTIADTFACSIASVIFVAGDERVMDSSSLLMIHNAWTASSGDSESLRKQADDLDKITQASINAYLGVANISEEDLKELMKNETWLDAQEALRIGLATKFVPALENHVSTQSVRKELMQKVLNKKENRPKKMLNELMRSGLR